MGTLTTHFGDYAAGGLISHRSTPGSKYRLKSRSISAVPPAPRPRLQIPGTPVSWFGRDEFFELSPHDHWRRTSSAGWQGGQIRDKVTCERYSPGRRPAGPVEIRIIPLVFLDHLQPTVKIGFAFPVQMVLNHNQRLLIHFLVHIWNGFLSFPTSISQTPKAFVSLYAMR